MALADWNRRHFLGASFAAPLLQLGATKAAAATPAFHPQAVRQIAKELATKPYRSSDAKLPQNFQDLNYDRYRTIRFLPERALWRGENIPFEVQFFHPGFLFSNRVDIFQVVDGQAAQIPYDASAFSFGDVGPPPAGANPGFAGFRIHSPMNRPDYKDEVCVFLGASYFRAVAKGQTYGLSARGLAINVADKQGEEFPAFKAFWLEKPAPDANSIVVHALLDTRSASAAYRFTIRPGDTTVFDVETAVYPRVDIAKVALAPMTSMYFFGPNDRADVDDFRSAVHDSDGLAIQNGRGEQIWRALSNPTDLQISSFADQNPRGFGLMQRERSFAAYRDLESHFEKRPSLWAEPIGDWGEGIVCLVEIPTKEETNDNIVAFWQPEAPLAAKGEHTYTYRLHWGAELPRPYDLARASRTFAGQRDSEARLFVVEFAGDGLKGVDAAQVSGAVSADKGEIRHVVTQPNPETGGWRLSFELLPNDNASVEMRAQLRLGAAALSEVWLYRWTS